MTEVVQALKLVSETYPLAKIIVGGHSAGAQLAASLLTSDVLSKAPALGKRIVGMYFISGVYDLRPLVNTTINKALKLTPENAEHLSALFNDIHPSWLTVPLKNQVIVGYYDSPEFQRQSTGYYEQLKSQFDTTFWVSQFDDHFTLVEGLASPKSETCKKLKTYLKQFKNVLNLV
jgi:arylformamidase